MTLEQIEIVGNIGNIININAINYYSNALVFSSSCEHLYMQMMRVLRLYMYSAA